MTTRANDSVPRDVLPNPDIPSGAGRPELAYGNRQLLFGGLGRLSESAILNLHNRSYTITADIFVPKPGAEGVIIAVGGLRGGFSLYAKGGTLKHCYNFFGLHEFVVESGTKIPDGRHQVRMQFKYDGGGAAKGGNVTLYIDGKHVGDGKIDRTDPGILFADETCEIGTDSGSSVTSDYGEKEFTGTVNWVELDLSDNPPGEIHMITPEPRPRLAMATP